MQSTCNYQPLIVNVLSSTRSDHSVNSQSHPANTYCTFPGRCWWTGGSFIWVQEASNNLASEFLCHLSIRTRQLYLATLSGNSGFVVCSGHLDIAFDQEKESASSVQSRLMLRDLSIAFLIRSNCMRVYGPKQLHPLFWSEAIACVFLSLCTA